MPALTHKKRRRSKVAAKKPVNYATVVVEPAMRLANLLTKLEEKASFPVRSA